MIPHSRWGGHAPARRAVAMAAAALFAACSTAVGPEPEPEGPTITVRGVEDGGRYTGAVAIEIDVDRGSWEARLNGERISSRHEVDRLDDYTLVVTAQDGILTSRVELAFEIALDGASRLILRLIDLGDNPLGGGGDAILLTDSSAAGMLHMLVDAGRGPNGSMGNSSTVLRRLQDWGIDTLALMVLSHAHLDHYGGMPAILRDLHVRSFLYNGQVRQAVTYQDLLAGARANADSVIVVDAVREYRLGEVEGGTRVVILPPLSTWIHNHTDGGSELNEGSLGAYIQRGGFTLFLTGDGEYAANQRWRNQFAQFTNGVEVLKVGHHGANNAIFDSGNTGPSTWLEHTAPAVALVTANGRSHPRVNALARLHAQPGLEVYCTSTHGTIEMRVSPTGRYRLDIEKNRGAACTPGSEANT
jgi:beta-lactamase superfamily II metal-dependent hydrolase